MNEKTGVSSLEALKLLRGDSYKGKTHTVEKLCKEYTMSFVGFCRINLSTLTDFFIPPHLLFERQRRRERGRERKRNEEKKLFAHSLNGCHS